jgi:DNA-directed RNA polymerase specialized sigma24 family protein
MENETDASLFVYLSFIGTDPVEGNAALQELMNRYGAILRRHCGRICSRYPSQEIDGDELENATFYRATERASTYKRLEKEGAGAEDHIRYTAAWLCRIASNLLFDARRREARNLPYEHEFSEPDSMSPADVAHLLVGSNPGRFGTADKPLVAQAFESLKERSQLVVIGMLDKRQRSPSGRYMSRGAQVELARRLGTTPANVRQIWTRALAGIYRTVKDARFRNRNRT